MIALTASLRMVVSGYIKSGAKTDVTVRVRPRIVQIERAQPGVRAIVPVAPAKRESVPRIHNAVPCCLALTERIQPPIIFPSSTSWPTHISYLLMSIYRKSLASLTRRFNMASSISKSVRVVFLWYRLNAVMINL